MHNGLVAQVVGSKQDEAQMNTGTDYATTSFNLGELIFDRTGARWVFWVVLFAIASLVSLASGSPAALLAAVAVLSFSVFGWVTA